VNDLPDEEKVKKNNIKRGTEQNKLDKYFKVHKRLSHRTLIMNQKYFLRMIISLYEN